jgi:D-alanyl-D-alanine endopeptidase (penicillin-binding protein 7)
LDRLSLVDPQVDRENSIMNKQGFGLPVPMPVAVLLVAALGAASPAYAARHYVCRHYAHHRRICRPYLYRPDRAADRRITASHPYVRSSEALVFDATRSRVLYAKRAAGVTPIASITKLMTTLVVAEAHQPLDQALTVTRADMTPYSHLPLGARLTRAQFFHLALMSSENRAAHVLARNYPGGVGAAVRAMNAKARALGMTHTHFVEPTGLSAGDVSTPDDLAKLVLAASHNRILRRYSTSAGYAIRVGRWRLPYYPTDPLVRDRWWHIVLQKTGFTDPAGQCLVLDAWIAHHDIIVVLMHSWGQYTRTADAMRVRQWVERRFARLRDQTVAGDPASRHS